MARRKERHAGTKRTATSGGAEQTGSAHPAAAPAGSTLEATALFMLLAVVAARPLILDAYSAAQLGPAIDLRQSYFLADAIPQESPHVAFLRVLSPSPAPREPIEVTVPAGSVREGHAITPPGVPGRARWETGPWTVHVAVVRPSRSVTLSVRVRRVSEDGVRPGEEHAAPMQALAEAGSYVFTFPSLGWRAGEVVDRIEVVYRFHNTSDADARVTLQAGSDDSRTTTPGVYIAALPGPMLTVGFDAIILAALVLYGGAIAWAGRWTWRRTGARLGAAILFAGLIVSTAVAGNQRLAIVSASDSACLVLLAMLLAQLLRRPWQARLALCVLVATAAVAGARCVEQMFEFEDTIAQYAQSEAEAWSAGGRNANDPAARLFRSRLTARNPTAYMAHPNIAGSYFLLAAFAAAALAAAKFTAPPRTFRRLFACLSAAVALFLVVAMGVTSSRGAVVAAAAAAVVFAALAMARHRLARHRGRVLAAGWLCVLVGALGVVGLGRATGTLPSDSLAFRWQYWSAAWPMILDHLLGVGGGHFGRYYLRYKPVTSPDEVANAHNLFVHAAAEWGVLGLAGLVALLVGVSAVLARPAMPIAQNPEKRTCPVFSGRVLAYAGGLSAAVVAMFAGASYGTTGAHLVLVCTIPVLVFPMAFLLGALDSDRLDRFGDEPLPIALWFLGAGLFAFCVHNMISFSLYVPAAATPFFALAAVALSVRHAGADSPPRPVAPAVRVALPAAFTCVFAVFMLFVFRPVTVSGGRLFAARTATHYGPLPRDPRDHPAARWFAAAAEGDPLDPVPPSDWARWLVAYPYQDPPTATARLEDAVRLMHAAIARDPQNAQRYRQLAGGLATAFGWSPAPQYLQDAIAAAQRVVALYPQSPQDDLSLAELYDRLFEVTNDRTAAEHARAAYQRALDLDAARPMYEVRRFSPAVRRAAEACIQRLQTETVSPP